MHALKHSTSTVLNWTVASLKFNMEGYITSSVCGKRAGLQVAETNYFLRLYATFDWYVYLKVWKKNNYIIPSIRTRISTFFIPVSGRQPNWCMGKSSSRLPRCRWIQMKVSTQDNFPGCPVMVTRRIDTCIKKWRSDHLNIYNSLLTIFT